MAPPVLFSPHSIVLCPVRSTRPTSIRLTSSQSILHHQPASHPPAHQPTYPRSQCTPRPPILCSCRAFFVLLLLEHAPILSPPSLPPSLHRSQSSSSCWSTHGSMHAAPLTPRSASSPHLGSSRQQAHAALIPAHAMPHRARNPSSRTFAHQMAHPSLGSEACWRSRSASLLATRQPPSPRRRVGIERASPESKRPAHTHRPPCRLFDGGYRWSLVY